MRTSRTREAFVCAECGSRVERMQGVPVLESLADHAVYGCVQCGHILIMQEERDSAWSAEWLGSITEECAVTCATLV